VFVGQPYFDQNGWGVLPVTVLEKDGSSLVLYTVAAERSSWLQLQSIPLAPGYQPGAALPFSRFQERWWSGIPDSSTLYTADGQSQRAALLAAQGLPAGPVVLDFADEQKGWALVQESACFGDKIPGGQFIPGANPFSCLTGMSLFRTSDGGQTWQEVLFK
jgi:photosystem II stability/assembly factor-like uncharacterized protein